DLTIRRYEGCRDRGCECDEREGRGDSRNGDEPADERGAYCRGEKLAGVLHPEGPPGPLGSRDLGDRGEREPVVCDAHAACDEKGRRCWNWPFDCSEQRSDEQHCDPCEG